MRHSMRLVIYDVADPRRRVVIGARPWRVLLQEFVTRGVLDKPSANRLQYYLGGRGSSIGSAECHSIAEFVRTCLLSVVPDGCRIILSLAGMGFDQSPSDTLGVPMDMGRQSMKAAFPRRWLEEFADLCSASNGLGVIADSVEPRALKAVVSPHRENS